MEKKELKSEKLADSWNELCNTASSAEYWQIFVAYGLFRFKNVYPIFYIAIF
jgi:hypothetical protein